MLTLREYIRDNPPIDEAEHLYFSEMSRDWQVFNQRLRLMEMDQVVRLLHYMTEHKYHSRKLIERTVQRYNVLNKATIEDVL
jgi:hypothetical protein